MDEIDIPIPQIEMTEAHMSVGLAATIVGVTALAVGLGLGYFLGKRDGKVTVVPPEDEFEDDGQLTIFDVETRITTPTLEADNELKRAIGEARNAEDRVNRIIEERLAEDDDVGEDEVEQDTEARVITNVFASQDTWDFEVELANRNAARPYVIHQDEFMADEMDFNQETLTYYEGDDILADADDTPIYDYQGLMGTLQFGHGTSDPNVVYLRNEVLHMEWEILRHYGRFEQEVLGLAMEKEAEDELRHSVLKFRDE